MEELAGFLAPELLPDQDQSPQGDHLRLRVPIRMDQDPYNLGAHLVAAYLNVKSNKISFFTIDVLKSIWHDLCTYNYYSPTAGVKWYAEDVARYLTKTEG